MECLGFFCIILDLNNEEGYEFLCVLSNHLRPPEHKCCMIDASWVMLTP